MLEFGDDFYKQESELEKIIRDYWIHLNPQECTIADNGSVDVSGSVKFIKASSFITELPLTFNKVSGNFDCSRLSLTSLKGSPIEVGGDFDCSFNNLTSLEFVPKKVNGVFIFDNMVHDISTVKSSFARVMLLQLTDDKSSPLLPEVIKYSDHLSILFKYMNYYNAWNTDGSLHPENWNILIEDILNGLE